MLIKRYSTLTISLHFYWFVFLVESVSQFRFDKDGIDGMDTKCAETVQYECPIVFSPLCHREVKYQRKEIMKRLKLEFTTNYKKNYEY